VEDGSIHAAADPALISQIVITLVQGVVLRWSLFDHGFDLSSQADMIWTVIRPALEPKKQSPS
jgi:hypothetical protein